ncbi:hypothetical protein WJX84_003980 [Apatococcus fuscideae]|uniref:Uncharacterized protein n=1 Tax=Apatococcus fuscideae TaxID=2026836 RepID=A0AAW1SQB3_9CHLO
MEGQEPQRHLDSLGGSEKTLGVESHQSGRIEDHEQRLGTAESNMRELRMAINRISDRLRAACLSQDRQGMGGGETIEQAHGLLEELSNRVASLETRLAQASPTSRSSSSKQGFASTAEPTLGPDGSTILQPNLLFADAPGSTQQAAHMRDGSVAKTSLARVELSVEQQRILVEEQGLLLRQVETRVEVIMEALEERASEMLQGASLNSQAGNSQASLSQMLGSEMERIQQALEHRFSRVEADIETLIQQEWKISAAADAAAERQVQARMSEHEKLLRDREEKLMAMQKLSMEEESGRRAYENLVQQLQQGMTALGTRLAQLESAADRDVSDASQASTYGHWLSRMPLTASSMDSDEHADLLRGHEVAERMPWTDLPLPGRLPSPSRGTPSSAPGMASHPASSYRAGRPEIWDDPEGDVVEYRRSQLDMGHSRRSSPTQGSAVSAAHPQAYQGDTRWVGPREEASASSRPPSGRPMLPHQSPHATVVVAPGRGIHSSHGRPHSGHPQMPSLPQTAAMGPTTPQGMEVLPEEDITAEARDTGAQEQPRSSPGKSERLRKRLQKPGQSCKGCVIS